MNGRFVVILLDAFISGYTIYEHKIEIIKIIKLDFGIGPSSRQSLNKVEPILTLEEED